MSPAVFGWLAAAASMSLLWPQVWVSCARRRTRGLSPTATWLAAGLPVGWLTYGLLIGDAVQVVTNVVNGVAALAILVALLTTQPVVRSGRALLTSAGPVGILLLVVVAAVVAAMRVPGVSAKAAAAALGGVLAVVGLVAGVPQPLALLRDSGRSLSGLSPVRWWLGLCSGSMWTVYGLRTGQGAVWASAMFGLVCTSVVCAFLVRGRRAAPACERAVPAAPAPAALTVSRALHAEAADGQRLLASAVA